MSPTDPNPSIKHQATPRKTSKRIGLLSRHRYADGVCNICFEIGSIEIVRICCVFGCEMKALNVNLDSAEEIEVKFKFLWCTFNF